MTSNTSQNVPSKTSGQYHSVKGAVVETIGNVTGSTSWKQSGNEEHAQGNAEYEAAKAQGHAEGTRDRIGGKKDSVVGALTGDKSQEAKGVAREEKGESQQYISNNI